MKGGPKMQHVHVEDVAGAAMTLLEAPENKVTGRAFNVGDDTPLGQGDLFQAIMPALDMEEAFTYPYYTRAFWPFIRALLALPEGAFGKLNNWLERRWKDVVSTHDLKEELVPRLDRDFLGYMNADYVLDNSSLKSLGYELKYPDARAGLATAVDWYQKEGWLPEFD